MKNIFSFAENDVYRHAELVSASQRILSNKKPLCGEIAVRGLLKFDIYRGFNFFFFLYINNITKFASPQAESLIKS